MNKKGLAVGIILLFVGVAVAPSINANNSKTSSDGLVVVVRTDKDIYQFGEPVEISIYVENHGNENITVVFPTTQMADFIVDNFCYQWSAGKVFLPTPISITIPSGGRVLLLNDRWTQVDLYGNQVRPGGHDITGWMVKSQNYPIIYAYAHFWIGSELDIRVRGGINATIFITNVGPFDATNVRWIVSITGGVYGFINISKSFSADHMGVGETISKTLHPLGFGPVVIDMIAYAADVGIIYRERRMLVILFIVYPI